MSRDDNKNYKGGGNTASAVDGGDTAYYYRTYQGIPSYSQPSHQSPAIGFPQPVPPPGAAVDPSVAHQYYAHGYQTVPGYALADGRPLREPRLPCCGLGFGWFLFIFGFLLAGIPWYLAVLILVCSRVDYREKPGYVACTIMLFVSFLQHIKRADGFIAILATIAIVFGMTSHDDWDWH